MASVLSQIRQLLPEVKLREADAFFWSPNNQTVSYNTEEIGTDAGAWALLHETAHAVLGHTGYQSDIELLMLEVEAWQEAKTIASKLGITIDEEHIQDCLDTYRDWLHQRSTCPVCGVVCLQANPRSYHCHNCHNDWLVSASRFCRPYRLSKGVTAAKKLPEAIQPRAMFR